MRVIAASIDELLGMGIEPKISYRETTEVADEINKTLDRKPWIANKGYKYDQGTHWTQRPENKERLAKMIRKAARARRKKAESEE